MELRSINLAHPKVKNYTHTVPAVPAVPAV